MKLAQFFTRIVVMLFICGFMAFINVVPAIAANDIQKGMEQLPNIQTKAEEVLKDPLELHPYGQATINSKGLNEVQGSDDYDKMYSGANGDTPPAIEQVEKALEKVGGKIEDKAEDTINSVNGKAKDIAKSIKNNFKS